jgi:hypothetical protein
MTIDLGDSLKIAEMEVERLEAWVKPWKELVAELRRQATINAARNLREGPETKYANVRPLLAIQSILNEHGKAIPKAEIIALLMKGGITYGKKRAGTNVEMGIARSVRAGSLTMTGKDELIGLPEWKSKK